MSGDGTERTGEEIAKLQCPICDRVFVITGHKAIGIPDGAKRPCLWDCREEYDNRLYADGGTDTSGTEHPIQTEPWHRYDDDSELVEAALDELEHYIRRADTPPGKSTLDPNLNRCKEHLEALDRSIDTGVDQDDDREVRTDGGTDRRKATIYGCPAPGCLATKQDSSELAEHVNEEHPGEWTDPDWPDPEVDR